MTILVSEGTTGGFSKQYTLSQLFALLFHDVESNMYYHDVSFILFYFNFLFIVGHFFVIIIIIIIFF
jgi:hypothetical protein